MILRRLAEKRSLENPAVPLTSQSLVDMYTQKVSAGVSVNEPAALCIPAVNRAVSLIAGTAAGLPLKTYRTETDGTRIETSTRVLAEPYPDVTPFVFWELAYVDCLLWANSYSFKVKNEAGSEVVKLLRIPPRDVTLEKGDATARNPSGKLFQIGGGSDRYTPAEIMHIPAMGMDGLTGLSKVGLGREALGLALAAEQTAAKLFGDGLLLAGVLTSDQVLDDEVQAKAIANRFRDMVRGTSPKIPVLGRGVKFESMSMHADEAQFIEARAFQVLEIARLWGIPPPLLMVDGATSNYGTGLEQQMIFFLITTLDGWLRRFEQAITLHLVAGEQFAEYTRAALLRTDTKSRYDAYAQGIQFGFLSPADIRRFENLPVEDPSLEEFLRPVNMTPSDGPALKDQVEAVGALIRAGFDPEAAVQAVGLPAITHLGLLPVTLQKEEVFDAQADEAETVAADEAEEVEGVGVASGQGD